jgi:hypothetical protein
MRPVGELRKHPAYTELNLAVSPAQLAAIQELGDLAFKDPILITAEGIIIDGYARRELAEKLGIPALCCVEFNIDEEESLRRILNNHRRSSGWNDYNRIKMASKLRDLVRRRAVTNQEAGGKLKGLSKLTEANRVNVRKEIAIAAGVSEGSVTKVDQLEGVHPELLAALQSGEIRIHRAWLWRTFTQERQREHLRLYRMERGLKQKAKTLISKHRVKTPTTATPLLVTTAAFTAVANLLSAMPSYQIGQSQPILIGVLDVPGKGVFLTKELFQAARTQ